MTYQMPVPRFPTEDGTLFTPAGQVQSLGPDQPKNLTVNVMGMSQLHASSGASFDNLTLAVRTIETTGSAFMFEGPRIRRLFVSGAAAEWGKIVAGEYAFFGSIRDLESIVFQYLDVRDKAASTPQSLMRLHAGAVRVIHVQHCRLEKSFGLDASGVKPMGRWYCQPLEALVYDDVEVVGPTNLNLGGPPSPTSPSFRIETVVLRNYRHHTDKNQFFNRGPGIPIKAENVGTLVLDFVNLSNPAEHMIEADPDVKIVLAGGATYNGKPFDEALHVKRSAPHTPRVIFLQPPGEPVEFESSDVVVVEPPVKPVDPVVDPPPPPPVEETMNPFDLTVYCWDPVPNVAPCYDGTARFFNQASAEATAARLVRALNIPRGTRPISCLWQNHCYAGKGGVDEKYSLSILPKATGPRGRVPTPEELNEWENRIRWWREHTDATIEYAIDMLGSKELLPKVWIFDNESRTDQMVYGENDSEHELAGWLYESLREYVPDGTFVNWKGGDTAYGAVMYGQTPEETLEREAEIVKMRADRELFPWIPMANQPVPRGIHEPKDVELSVIFAKKHGAKRLTLWGDWLGRDRSDDWNHMNHIFLRVYGEDAMMQRENADMPAQQVEVG